MKKTLTHSSTRCFRVCPRKYHYRYGLALAPDIESEALAIGSAYALAHELEAKGLSLAEITGLVRERGRTPVAGEIALRLWLGHRWYYQDAKIKVIAAEVEFEVPIENPETGGVTPKFRRRGKADAIVRLADDRVVLREQKTTSEDIAPGSPYWAERRNESQTTGYLLAMNPMPESVLYDVARKPQSRPRLITEAELELFHLGREARQVAPGTWYGVEGFSLDVDLLKVLPHYEEKPVYRETEEMCAARIKAEGKSRGKPRKLTEKEHADFWCGVDEPALEPSRWYGELVTSAWGPEPVEDKPGRYRESAVMFGARVSAEIAADPGRYYQQIEMPKTGQDFVDYALGLWQTQQMIQSCERAGVWPKNDASCSPYRGVFCDFLHLCSEGIEPSRDEGAPAGFVFMDDPHPELEAK